jgi:TPR repeat protein
VSWATRLASAAALALAVLVPAVARDRDALGRACVEGSDGPSCARLGDLVERGRLRARYPEEAGIYLALACEQGAAGACPRAERWAGLYSDYEALETDVGCMLRGSAFACEEVADALRRDWRDAPPGTDLRPLARARMRRAMDLYLQGCAKDDAPSCLGASRVYDAAFGVPASPRDARATEAKACALGLAGACEMQGDHLQPRRAVSAYRRACDDLGGSPHACLKLARAYEASGAEPRTIEAAYRRACDDRALDACAWLSAHGVGPAL